MLIGLSVDSSYDGPQVGAVEFRIMPNDPDRSRHALDALHGRFGNVSAHLPSYMSANAVESETAFDDLGRVDHFVSHVTLHTPYNAWRRIPQLGRQILFENHNQDWHPTDAGWCRADDFKPVVDAGFELCLDTGHVLYSCMSRGRIEEAEEEFEKFLQLPIAACHLHTVGPDPAGRMVDHMLDGYDIGPWVRRIEAKYPDVILIVETGHSQFSHADKLAALARWRGLAR